MTALGCAGFARNLFPVLSETVFAPIFPVSNEIENERRRILGIAGFAWIFFRFFLKRFSLTFSLGTKTKMSSAPYSLQRRRFYHLMALPHSLQNCFVTFDWETLIQILATILTFSFIEIRLNINALIHRLCMSVNTSILLSFVQVLGGLTVR